MNADVQLTCRASAPLAEAEMTTDAVALRIHVDFGLSAVRQLLLTSNDTSAGIAE
jgi:hypothetical protein